MSKRTSELLIEDILESCNKIINYTKGISYDDFVLDQKTVDAVIRNFEIIGEAANRLPDEYKDAHPEIDWFRIRGFRNRIVHDYFGIDYSIVWQIKETYLPLMINNLNQLNCNS
ncbi:MAG: DUF86 domain-containing protein [Candidatus Symbiothrix sp.]|jgi:uncharacterized protein with HEPN domain|nr:DUF86 domain-containing protein [Candidatus Symbiothrix sp.]